ncbi:protein of unknown function [Hyphomicrobium sp. MC1]|nr:protein of unknown function [Hyphomicrobium sp. MC1]
MNGASMTLSSRDLIGLLADCGGLLNYIIERVRDVPRPGTPDI